MDARGRRSAESNGRETYEVVLEAMKALESGKEVDLAKANLEWAVVRCEHLRSAGQSSPLNQESLVIARGALAALAARKEAHDMMAMAERQATAMAERGPRLLWNVHTRVTALSLASTLVLFEVWAIAKLARASAPEIAEMVRCLLGSCPL